MNRSKIDPEEVIIAIDPDADRSGVAMLEVATRRLEVATLVFPALLDYLLWANEEAEKTCRKFIVVIEAGWLNRSHWHINSADSRRCAAAKGNAVGRNHETGRKIAEVCEYHNIPFRLLRPLPLRVGGRPLWKGKDGKITAEELRKITSLSGRTNQEERDAALIAWIEAGFSIDIRGKGSRLI